MENVRLIVHVFLKGKSDVLFLSLFLRHLCETCHLEPLEGLKGKTDVLKKAPQLQFYF